MQIRTILCVAFCLFFSVLLSQNNGSEVHYKVGMLGGVNSLGNGVSVGLDVGVEYDQHSVILRGNFNSEVGHSRSSFIGPPVNYNGTIWESGLMYGRAFNPKSWYYTSFSA